jgi:biopolymer transport protein TolQ
MNTEMSVLAILADASFVVKCVIFILLAASLLSWTIIFQRHQVLKAARALSMKFEDKFWSGIELSRLHNETTKTPRPARGSELVFIAGFKEFIRLRKQTGYSPEYVMEGTTRAMRVARSREIGYLENHLSLLATIGSTSPYIGLFGTVWGIMNSFMALGQVQQATLSMVAPGIAEALIATAIGLFAAIPAVIFYNRFATMVDKLDSGLDNFQEEFSSILSRQARQSEAGKKATTQPVKPAEPVTES